nr:isoaspartyl peptidase/L-asparaginase [Qipengyuania thermophila]
MAMMATLGGASARAQEWTLVIHGGAGVIERERMTPERDAAVRAALNAALAAGGAVLDGGGSALDAVEAAVRVLEDDPNFNAGRGAVFTADGTNELDAAIMDGRSRAAGAVAGVTATRNPISLARAVMERSGHVMLIGAGADAFSRAEGLEQAAPEWFATPERREQLERWRAAQQQGQRQSALAFDPDHKFGTVGAVARDSAGNLAAATSTGGVTGKRWGRVGDAPLIGAGTFADATCAVSATGAGEFYIRMNVAHEICARVRLSGDPVQQAADAVQAETLQLGGSGGVIALTADGAHAFSFNTPGMYRGVARRGAAATVAIYGDE